MADTTMSPTSDAPSSLTLLAHIYDFKEDSLWTTDGKEQKKICVFFSQMSWLNVPVLLTKKKPGLAGKKLAMNKIIKWVVKKTNNKN